MNTRSRWDIFCAVVDNYGDIGVCWRLARQLAREHGIAARLWVDDLAPLARLRPGAEPARDSQHLDGVEVRRWRGNFSAPDNGDMPDVVIEAFACELPAAYLAAMTRQHVAPVWINLEYLSAEAWVEDAHGLPSPHPSLPLTKYFFFPGFTPKTGGLIREADYDRRRAAFDPAALRALLKLPPRHANELTVSLFGYENPALSSLLDVWARHPRPVRCLVPEGRLLPQVCEFFGGDMNPMQRGNLSVHVIPFLAQPDYDALLWLCDINFVRGEDSFVRAQWAAKPFVWHIYPQQAEAHLAKLDTFLARYLRGAPASAAQACRDLWNAWNDGGDVGVAWPAFAASLPVLVSHTQRWTDELAQHGDLASNLRRFVAEKSNK